MVRGTGTAPERFVVKDSGARQSYASGMVRDTQEGKADFLLIRSGPMLERWAEHLTKGAVKYGPDNWTLACSDEELRRFRASAARHFEQWLAGDRDEDHAAAVFFNLNAAEYVAARVSHDIDVQVEQLRASWLYPTPERACRGVL